MSEDLNNLLIKAYCKWESEPENSPIPLKIIKEFLKMEGIHLDDYKG